MNQFLNSFLKDHPLMGIEEDMPRWGHKSGPALPDWVLQGPICEIFVRNFSPRGNFTAVQEKLPYFKDLGIKTLWLMPIHPIGKKDRKGNHGSPYAIADYRAIDPALGSRQDLQSLIKTAHQMGLRLILDLVINHTANDHAWHDHNPAYYHYPGQSDRVRKAAEWTDITDLNYEHTDLRDELRAMLRYWVEEFDVDGYRCDVAGLVPLDFWEAVVAELLTVKKDLFMLAEWQSSRLHDQAFHSYYDWVLYWILCDIRKGKRKVGDIITWQQLRRSLFPQQTLGMLFTENHDLPRTLKTFGRESYQPFSALSFLLGGLPLIYAGQEQGAQHLPPLFEKENPGWEEGDPEIFRFYQNMIRLYCQHPVLRTGRLEFMDSGQDTVLILKKYDDNQTFCAILNFSGREKSLEVPALKDLIGTDSLSGELFDGSTVRLKPWQVQIVDVVDDGLLVV